MSKRAEEAALNAYPDYRSWDGGYVTQRKPRTHYIKGYEQAEKDTIERVLHYIDENIHMRYDEKLEWINEFKKAMEKKEVYKEAEERLALTWKDIAKIDEIITDTYNEFAIDCSKEISRQNFYEEVLKQFNETLR